MIGRGYVRKFLADKVTGTPRLADQRVAAMRTFPVDLAFPATVGSDNKHRRLA
jgi:hypothetical protein